MKISNLLEPVQYLGAIRVQRDTKQALNIQANTAPSTVSAITLKKARDFGNAVSCPTSYWFVVYEKDGNNYKWVTNGDSGKSGTSSWDNLYHGESYVCPDPSENGVFLGSGEVRIRDVNFNGIEQIAKPKLRILGLNGIV